MLNAVTSIVQYYCFAKSAFKIQSAWWSNSPQPPHLGCGQCNCSTFILSLVSGSCKTYHFSFIICSYFILTILSPQLSIDIGRAKRRVGFEEKSPQPVKSYDYSNLVCADKKCQWMFMWLKFSKDRQQKQQYRNHITLETERRYLWGPPDVVYGAQWGQHQFELVFKILLASWTLWFSQSSPVRAHDIADDILVICHCNFYD